MSEPNALPIRLRDQIGGILFAGMRNAVGEDGAQSLMYNLGLYTYTRRAHEFHSDLCGLFGSVEQAIMLEKIIIKELCKEYGISYVERVDFQFEEEIANMGTALEKKLKTTNTQDEMELRKKVEHIRAILSDNPGKKVEDTTQKLKE